MAISSDDTCRRRHFFDEKTRASFKAARKDCFDKTGDHAAAENAYKRTYCAACREVKKHQAIVLGQDISKTAPQTSLLYAITQEYFEKSAGANKQNLMANKNTFLPVQIYAHHKASYFSDAGIRYVSNLTVQELDIKTKALLKEDNIAQHRYLEVQREVLEDNILDLAPEEKALNQRIFDEILLPEYLNWGKTTDA